MQGLPTGCLHVGFAEVHTKKGRQYLFVPIDRTRKVAFAELRPQTTKMVAANSLRRVLAKLPCQVHTVLTDHDIRFGKMRHRPWAFRYIFDRVHRARRRALLHQTRSSLHQRLGRAHEPHD